MARFIFYEPLHVKYCMNYHHIVEVPADPMCSVHMYALGMVCQDQKWSAKMHNWLRSAEVFEPFEIRPQLVGVAGRDCRCLHCLQDGLLDSVQLRRICERHLSVLRVPSGDRTEVSEVKWSEVRQRPVHCHSGKWTHPDQLICALISA